MKGKMEVLIEQAGREDYSPELEGNFLEVAECPSCKRKALVTLKHEYARNNIKKMCVCGYERDSSDLEEDTGSLDYDPDWDLPPGYMDECPPDCDPEMWREFYTGG